MRKGMVTFFCISIIFLWSQFASSQENYIEIAGPQITGLQYTEKVSGTEVLVEVSGGVRPVVSCFWRSLIMDANGHLLEFNRLIEVIESDTVN